MANLSLLSTYGLLFSLYFVAQLDAIKEPTQINEFEQVNQVNLLNGKCCFFLFFLNLNSLILELLSFKFENLS